MECWSFACARSSSAFVPQRRQVLDEVDEFFLVIACDKFSGMIEIFCLTRRAMVLAGMSWYLPSVSLIVTASGAGGLEAADDVALLRFHDPALVTHQNPGVGFQDRLVKLDLLSFWPIVVSGGPSMRP